MPTTAISNSTFTPTSSSSTRTAASRARRSLPINPLYVSIPLMKKFFATALVAATLFPLSVSAMIYSPMYGGYYGTQNYDYYSSYQPSVPVQMPYYTLAVPQNYYGYG